MLEKVFRKVGVGGPSKGRVLIRRLGIVSLFMWIVALGAVYAVIDHKVPRFVEEAVTGKKFSAPAPAETKPPAEKSSASLPGVAEVAPSSEEREALRQLAEMHYANGELDEAAVSLQRLLLVPTRDLHVLTMATQTYLGVGLYRQALDCARLGLQLSPGQVDLEIAAVMAQYRLGQVEKALAEAKQDLQQQADNLDLLVALGTMEVEIGPKYPEYGKSLEAALKLKRDYAPALYLQGRKAQLEGNYHDAELAFRKVLKQDPKHAKALGQLGMALYHLRREAEAESYYRKALALNPKDYNTWFNLGEVNLAYAVREKSPAKIQSLRQAAMEAYVKAVEYNPQHAEAHFRIGVLLNGNGQYKEAILHLETALKLDASHEPTLVQLAVAYEGLKQPERAKACLEKARQLDPLDRVVLLKLKRLS